MSTRLANWTSETTETVGTGDITLTGVADASQARFRDGLNSGEVYYTIQDGANREAGIAIFNGVDRLTRSNIDSTLVNGIYNDTNPGPIFLTGLAVISGTWNVRAYTDILADITTLTSSVTTNTGDIAANVVSIAALENAETNLGPRVTQAEADIVTNTTDIATNASGISDLVNDLSHNETNVSAVVSGGHISGNGPTSILVLIGSGNIIDPNTEVSSTVNWSEQTFDLLANAGMPAITGLGVTDIGVNSAGALTAYPNGISSNQRKSVIKLGQVEYTNRVIENVRFAPIMTNQIGTILLDLVDYLEASVKIKGLVVRPTAITPNELSFWRDSGTILTIGANYTNDVDSQNIYQLSAEGSATIPVSFEPFAYNNASTVLYVPQTIVPDLVYEPAGNGLIDNVSNGSAVIHYIVQSLGNKFYLSYGQQEYASYAEATSNLFADRSQHKFAIEANDMLLLAQVVMLKGATDFDAVAAAIFPINSATSSSSGAGGATQAINIGYTDTYTLGGNVQAAIDTLASLKLTDTQHDAINGSSVPSATNVFTTMDDLIPYVPLSGGTLTGQLVGITPLAIGDLTRKDYVDGVVSPLAATTYVDAAVAPLATTVYVDAADATKAATTYVDAADALKLNLTGGTMTGQIVGITPVGVGDLCRKDYVDGVIATAAQVSYVDSQDNLKLNLSGGTVSGQIYGLYPTVSTSLARRDYVDNVGNLKLPLTGGTVSGQVYGQYPTGSTSLCRRDYVDNVGNLKIDKSGGTMTGQLYGLTPTSNSSLTTKSYTDNLLSYKATYTYVNSEISDLIPGGIVCRARINSSGGVTSHRGISSSQRLSTGLYRIYPILTTAQRGNYAVTATYEGTHWPTIVTISYYGTTYFEVRIENNDILTDKPFSIIVAV